MPPHTQRRIADYLLNNTTQAFVTSHSPYVIERFEPAQTLVLSRDEHSTVSAQRVSDASSLKDQDYKRFSRRGLTECMLGKGVIVVEGVTEFYALPVIERKLQAEFHQYFQPLDIAGVAFFDADGESNMLKFGGFFNELGLKTFSFYDFLKRTPEDKKKFTDCFTVDCEHPHAGFEGLMATEVPVARLWAFLSELRDANENGNMVIPMQQPDDDTVRKMTKSALSGKKGAGWSARPLEGSSMAEMPETAVNFLCHVHGHFLPSAEPKADAKPPAQAAVA